ncbi:MAG: hypothetical protein FJ276_36035 [Planctomycetes bacterium]|nr:hypothetical protein [Planctomycetota bacterium]
MEETRGLLLWALDRHPYGYYQILRWVTCAAGVYAAFIACVVRKTGWGWALGVVAFVFNPLIPFHLDRNTWQGIDVIAAGLFLVSTFMVREDAGTGNK